MPRLISIKNRVISPYDTPVRSLSGGAVDPFQAQPAGARLERRVASRWLTVARHGERPAKMVYYYRCHAWRRGRRTARRKDNHERFGPDQASDTDGTGGRRAVPADIRACPGGAGARYHARGRPAHHERARCFVVAGSSGHRRPGRFRSRHRRRVRLEGFGVVRERTDRSGSSPHRRPLELHHRAGATRRCRRIAKLSVFARSAPARVETSSKPRSKRRKRNATKSRPGTKAKPTPRHRPRSPSS